VDLQSFNILFEFDSAIPIRFESDGPIGKFSNRPLLPIARRSGAQSYLIESILMTSFLFWVR